jgi:hypothetical protein
MGRSCFSHCLPRARRELTHGDLAAFECGGQFRKGSVEHIVQQEGRTLQRRQTFERQQQCVGEIVGDLAGGLCAQGIRVGDRLWQPRSNVRLAPDAFELEPVQGQPCNDRRQISLVVLDLRAVSLRPFELGILHHVLSIGPAAQHAVGEAQQAASMRLESCC